MLFNDPNYINKQSIKNSQWDLGYVVIGPCIWHFLMELKRIETDVIGDVSPIWGDWSKIGTRNYYPCDDAARVL